MKKTKVVILFISIVLLVTSLDSAIIGNESDGAFGDGNSAGNRSPVGVKSTFTIGQYIAEGGGYYLRSYSDMVKILNRVEISVTSGMDIEELQGILNSAIDNMEHAKTAYLNLCSLAEATPYNQDVIVILMNFDYSTFKKENGLNPGIFKKVKELLSKGDVRGVYNRLYDDVSNILVQLYDLKENVDKNSFPNISALWRINQNFSQSILFGQYVAEVFYGIK